MAPTSPLLSHPLDLVADSVIGDPRYQFFDRADFMIMAKVVRKSRPDIVLYKHVHTRAYLNLDAGGGAYRFIPPAGLDRGDGRYVQHRSIEAALDDVGTWQLPWMKEGLEKYRYGYVIVTRDPNFAAYAVELLAC